MLVERSPAEISLTRRWLDALPGEDGCIELVASRIPDAGEAPLAGPVPAYQLRREMESGQVRMTLPSPLPEHEVVLLAVQKVGCS